MKYIYRNRLETKKFIPRKNLLFLIVNGWHFCVEEVVCDTNDNILGVKDSSHEKSCAFLETDDAVTAYYEE